MPNGAATVSEPRKQIIKFYLYWPEQMMVHYNIHVYGRVQGVGFRYSAQKAAEQHGITGFVRNISDGSVYLEIEGGADACYGFIEWLKSSPGLSRVDDVQVQESGMSHFIEFLIKR